MKTKTVRMTFLLAGLMLAVGPGLAQETSQEESRVDLPSFNCDLLCYATLSPDTARLDVYFQMPYEMLSFSKEGDAFRASYEVAISVEGESGMTVAEKTWVETVTTKNYGESSSERSGKMSQRTLPICPGTYTVKIRATDLDTKKTARVERKIVVMDFSAAPYALSDIMLVSRLTVEAEKKIIVPNVSGSVWNQAETLYLYFEAYNRTPADSIRFVTSVQDTKGEPVLKDTAVRALKGLRTSCFLPLAMAKLPAGMCTVAIQAALQGPAGDSLQAKSPVMATKKFTIRWRTVPVTINDIDLAIDQMIYATDRDTVVSLKKLPPDEKSKRFLAFWQRHNPNPGSARNEMMEEYYRRVDYANKNFTTYLDGWRSDRGMIYIIFGPPTNIDRHPFESDTRPYEVWTYVEGSRQFVFVDRTGFGDYRLQNPGYDVWRSGYH